MSRERICEGCCGKPVSKCDCSSDCKVCGGKDNMQLSFRSYFNHFEKALKPIKCKNCGAKIMPNQYKCPNCGKLNRTEPTSSPHLPEDKVRAAYKTSQYKPPEYS